MQVPLIGFIGRLDYQKGADLVLGAAHWLLNQDVQIVCLGTGDKHLEVPPAQYHKVCMMQHPPCKLCFSFQSLASPEHNRSGVMCASA